MSTETQHPRPFDLAFYSQAREAAQRGSVVETRWFGVPGACSIEIGRGESLRLTLAHGAQILGLQAFSQDDPDERIWTHETFLLEGLWMTRYTRLWSTMAHYRPLLTCLEDTVVMPRRAGGHLARHHPIPAGWSTPAQWSAAGGPGGRPSVWDQHVAALAQLGLPARLLKDDISLFQCCLVAPGSQETALLPSQARRGDYVTLFAERDVVVLLALNPYVDGRLPAAELGAVRPRPVLIERIDKAADPLPWPYDGVPYPDVGLYVGPDGRRLDMAAPTPGRESE